MKLGKNPARSDPRTLKLAKYIPEAAPAPPSLDWFSGIADFGMMGNDALGDCTVAALGHAVQIWYAATGSELTIPDPAIIDKYSRWCGYVPGNPATDRGGVELDVLNDWRREDFFGEQLIAYTDPSPHDREHVRKAIELFGLVYIGLDLPLTAEKQIGSLWDVMPGAGYDANPGSWGGHAVVVAGYDASGLTCVTWGRRQKMTWDFWEMYCDESHALLSATWLARATVDFKLSDLLADLRAVTG